SDLNTGVQGWWVDDVSILIVGPCVTGTPTATPTASGGTVLVGHVTWQGRPPQPSQLQMLPITLTLRSATGEGFEYDDLMTDMNGTFTVTLSGVPNGTHNWRVKGPGATPDVN